MTVRKWIARLLKYGCVGVLSLLLFIFLAIQIQQRTLRWRAERLLADIHQIRLYQSTWSDAQRLMRRWGAWGHYEGSCTAADCKYEIEIAGIESSSSYAPRHPVLDWLLNHDRLNLYQWFGGRGSEVEARFTVHEGTIWREGTYIAVSVPREKMHRATYADTALSLDDIDWSLSMGAGSYQRLHRTLDSSLFMGGAEQLGDHPYYKIGGPDGCKINCQVEIVYYSTHTPSAEIERLTSYDFSCFTRFHPCSKLQDLLPAAKEWSFHKENEQNPLEKPCHVPAWAQARDARYVLSVDALSMKMVKPYEDYGNYHAEVAKVRVLSSLKEPVPWLPGAIVSTDLLNLHTDASQSSQDKHLIPGRRYIVFVTGNDRRDRMLTKDSPLRFEYCGVYEDTAEVRRELEAGFAQNDTLGP